MTKFFKLTAATAFLTVAASPAFAHTGVVFLGESGFAAGFFHPLFGLDHLLAMLGVGIWGAQLGGRTAWFVPAAFVTMMVTGAALALAGAPLPMVELGIGGSVLIMGGLIALGARVPLPLAIGLVGLFGVFHGHAHGTELPGFAHPAGYGAGFALATSLLHAAGFGIAYRLRTQASRLPFRMGGAVMAAIGGSFLIGG